MHRLLQALTLLSTSIFLSVTQMAQASGTHTGSHDTAKESGTHGHASWAPTPEAFTAYQNPLVWSDGDAAQRGKVLYDQNCQVCHGETGTGQGPAAAAFEHKPADLTQHFHKEDGVSDAYLFWRVSEGGTVAPFAASKSMMPAFAGQMTEDQIWDLLAYVHQTFHQGFLAAMPMTMMEEHTDEPAMVNMD